MPDLNTHVIVGGGLAGAKAAEALRTEGFEGRIVLLAEEAEAPYERPPLSKDYLRGESPRESARVHPEGFYADHDIELRTGTTVTSVDPKAREVQLADGERIPYARLLLATGARPRRLEVPGAELDGVLTLRDLAGADALRARLPWVDVNEAIQALIRAGQTVDRARLADPDVPLADLLPAARKSVGARVANES